MKKLNTKAGFTLAELLIVVAIIAVLVAIAIPVFTAQLEKSREATDAANIRAAYAEMMVKAIENGQTTETVSVSLKQQDVKWRDDALKDGLMTVFNKQSDISTELDKVDKDKTVVVSWQPGTDTTDGYTKLAVS